MVQKEVKKKTRIYGASAVLLATVLVSMVYVIGSAPLILPSGSPAVGGMMVFSSNQELVNYLNTANNGQ
jgi:zinc transporter ZupT